jgi:hypothetical protein
LQWGGADWVPNKKIKSLSSENLKYLRVKLIIRVKPFITDYNRFNRVLFDKKYFPCSGEGPMVFLTKNKYKYKLQENFSVIENFNS